MPGTRPGMTSRDTRGRERSRPFDSCSLFSPLSSSPQADDPVTRGLSALLLTPAITGCPPFADMMQEVRCPILVIPGRATREPGIHIHDREYGFRACAKWRIHDVQLHIGE